MDYDLSRQHKILRASDFKVQMTAGGFAGSLHSHELAVDVFKTAAHISDDIALLDYRSVGHENLPQMRIERHHAVGMRDSQMIAVAGINRSAEARPRGGCLGAGNRAIGRRVDRRAALAGDINAVIPM